MSDPFADSIREKALSLGFDDVGITSAELPQEDTLFLQEWLGEGNHGNLSYLENPQRFSLQSFFPGAKSAIIFVTHYKQPKVPFSPEGGVIASYARGKDYHHLHRKRLKSFIQWLEEVSGKKGIAKGFSDASPVMEKALAVKAGLGWMGKNSLLIHRKFGTFTLLSGVLTTLALSGKEDTTRFPRCGSCTKCLDACPTQAISPAYKVIATRCLSYHLIESKEPLPAFIEEKNPGYAFGCDICQDVCPHNVKSDLSTQEHFRNENGQGSLLTLLDLENIEKNPETLFGTPLQRRKAPGLRRTLESLQKQRNR